MKLLIMTRMFTGFIDSLHTKKWQPKGIPAIYKLIEGLSKRNIPTDVVFLCKRKSESKHIKSVETFRFRNLNIQFHAVPFKENIFIKSAIVNNFINNIYQLFHCLKLIKRNKYSLIYSDRANIQFAAFFSFLFCKKKFVLRLLGVKQDQKDLIRLSNKIRTPFTYLSYLANFSYIICTQDGSGVEYFLSNIIRKKVPYEILLNGVDDLKYNKLENKNLRRRYGFIGNTPIILSVGKMEMAKGCIQFVETLIELDKINEHFYAIIVGDGPLMASLKDKVLKNDLEDKVIFAGAVNHSFISQYYQLCDIYVSLNMVGNLSNTVLEAMASGICIVMLGKDEKTLTDVSTERLVPDDVVVRIDRDNIVNDLTEKLAYLINNPEKINIYSERMRTFATEFLWTWNERINYEIELLEKVAKREFIVAND